MGEVHDLSKMGDRFLGEIALLDLIFQNRKDEGRTQDAAIERAVVTAVVHRVNSVQVGEDRVVGLFFVAVAGEFWEEDL